MGMSNFLMGAPLKRLWLETFVVPLINTTRIWHCFSSSLGVVGYMTRISRFYVGTWISYPLHDKAVTVIGEDRLIGQRHCLVASPQEFPQ